MAENENEKNIQNGSADNDDVINIWRIKNMIWRRFLSRLRFLGKFDPLNDFLNGELHK